VGEEANIHAHSKCGLHSPRAGDGRSSIAVYGTKTLFLPSHGDLELRTTFTLTD